MKSTRCPRFNFNRQDVQLGERALLEDTLREAEDQLARRLWETFGHYAGGLLITAYVGLVRMPVKDGCGHTLTRIQGCS
jgi:hypothetical protein